MAQNKPFKWYSLEDAPGFAGMVADTSTHVIDSFSAEGGVNPGEFVERGTDSAKQVKAVTTVADAAKVIGIAAHIHKEPETPYYPEGYTVPVMTFGDVYVEVAGDVKAGDPVAVKANGDKLDIVAGGADGVTALDGFTFLDNGETGDIVRIRVRK